MIYHLSVSSLSRGYGRSACAAAAYRTASIIKDDYYGVTHDFARKSGVICSGIIGYPRLEDETEDELRTRLWNAAEAAEKRKNSVVAREIRFALPHACEDGLRIILTEKYAKFLSEKYGVAVEYAVHAPSSEGDQRNYHAHLLFTSRPVDPETGEFASRKDRQWNLPDSSKTVLDVRETWADIYNEFARFAELPEISHRSHKDRGIDRIPGKHMGPARTALQRQGIELDLDDPSADELEKKRLEEESAKLTAEIADHEKELEELYQQELTDARLDAEVEEAGGADEWEKWRRVSRIIIPKELLAEVDEPKMTPEMDEKQEVPKANKELKLPPTTESCVENLDEAKKTPPVEPNQKVSIPDMEWDPELGFKNMADFCSKTHPDSEFIDYQPPGEHYLDEKGNRRLTSDGFRELFAKLDREQQVEEEKRIAAAIANELPYEAPEEPAPETPDVDAPEEGESDVDPDLRPPPASPSAPDSCDDL
jgi:hypothetical protein